jgi:lysophospholipase L1-like esterase
VNGVRQVRRAALAALVSLLSLHPTGPAAQDPFADPAATGGIQVYLKVDFDGADGAFQADGNGATALETEPAAAASGRSLHVRRAQPGSYFGARTQRIRVKGTRGLRIAFLVRGRGMDTVSVNLFDEVRPDNTTPASPARTVDDQWRPVVFAVEDFHHNSDPPHRKVPADTRHTSLLFHGQERPGGQGEFWIDKLVVYRGDDTQPPEAPTDVVASPRDGGTVELRWKEPADNAFAAVYSIHRKGAGAPWQKVAESRHPQHRDTVRAPGTYTYRITAADYDYNVSAPSSDVTVTALAAGPAESPTEDQIADRHLYAENIRRIHASGRGRVRHDVFLFAGDSITGAMLYSQTLASWLGRGLAVRQGEAGVTTDYGKVRITEYLAQARPEFVIVMYGTNDSKDRWAVERAMKNLAAVIDACALGGIVPIVATIPPRGYSTGGQGDQVRFNRALIALARSKKIPVSYAFEEMMRRDLRQMLYDGVHLTPGPGNDAAGEALWKTFQQVTFALRDSSAAWP